MQEKLRSFLGHPGMSCLTLARLLSFLLHPNLPAALGSGDTEQIHPEQVHVLHSFSLLAPACSLLASHACFCMSSIYYKWQWMMPPYHRSEHTSLITFPTVLSMGVHQPLVTTGPHMEYKSISRHLHGGWISLPYFKGSSFHKTRDIEEWLFCLTGLFVSPMMFSSRLCVPANLSDNTYFCIYCHSQWPGNGKKPSIHQVMDTENVAQDTQGRNITQPQKA